MGNKFTTIVKRSVVKTKGTHKTIAKAKNKNTHNRSPRQQSNYDAASLKKHTCDVGLAIHLWGSIPVRYRKGPAATANTFETGRLKFMVPIQILNFCTHAFGLWKIYIVFNDNLFRLLQVFLTAQDVLHLKQQVTNR